MKAVLYIYDSAGGYDSLEEVNMMKPVAVNPSATFTQLLEGLKLPEDEKQVQHQIYCQTAAKKARYGQQDNGVFYELLSALNVSVFEEDGRFRAQGGFTKINKIFGNQLENIILELNEYF